LGEENAKILKTILEENWLHLKYLIEQNRSCMNTVIKIGVPLKVTSFLIVGFRILCRKVACFLQQELYVSTVRSGTDLSAGT
jgi:hypothetical protein